MVTVGAPKETFPGERRVGLVPEIVADYRKRGLDVVVERGAGEAAGFPDPLYADKGARVVARDEVFKSDAILCIRCAGANPDRARDDLGRLSEGQLLVGLAEPLGQPGHALELATTGARLFALELLPRTTRAQAMDVLSSMATVAGYKSVLLAAERLPRFFPMLVTAAGTVAPARVLVVGAGVAGLMAIATARRLGAVVTAYDVRPAVKEEVASLGAKFLELGLEGGAGEGGYARAMDEAFYERQRKLLADAVAASDVVITTAAVPGKAAPRLVTAAMARAMGPGSVIVDLAAERGGNCELTKPGKTVEEGGVSILGPLNVPATVPYDASRMFSRNLKAFLFHLLDKEGRLAPDLEDEIVRETLVTRGGAVVHPRVRESLGGK
jgi:NAD(P) transhydrogenase subunit alpha